MRLLARLALVAIGFAIVPLSPSHPALAGSTLLSSVDRRLSDTATGLAGRSPLSAVEWLRRRPAVASASLHARYRAVNVTFRDGGTLSILPAWTRPGHRQSRPERLRRQVRVLRRGAQTAAARALVLEPFATELGLGTDAGQAEADALARAGFTVDILRDSAVTVQVMETLNRYSVVYMETHSDPLTAGGDAVVATGEVNTGADAALFADGSLKTVSVAGDGSHIYDAVTGVFFREHLGAFPNSSILFINGCGVRNATLFWQAVQSRNVAALIGWDNDVPGTLDALVGGYIVDQLAAGSSVADSILSATEQGLAVAVSDRGGATLGFAGDGFDTLDAARTGAPPPDPRPTPAPTVTPSPTPTATARPTATVRPARTRAACRPGRHRVHGRCVRIVRHKHHST